MRCCGSMAVASRSVMPKKSQSKPPTSSRKAPQQRYRPAGYTGLGVVIHVCVPAVSGDLVHEVVARSNASHRRCGIDSPGSRQAIPMTATGVAVAARNVVLLLLDICLSYAIFSNNFPRRMHGRFDPCPPARAAATRSPSPCQRRHLRAAAPNGLSAVASNRRGGTDFVFSQRAL